MGRPSACWSDSGGDHDGVRQAIRAAAVDFAKRGIRVNAVLPGLVETGMSRAAIDSQTEVVRALIAGHPIGRYGQPDELAKAVCWRSPLGLDVT